MYSWKISLDFIKHNKVNLIIFLIFTALAYPLEAIAVPQLYSTFFENLNHKTKPKTVIKFLAMIVLLLCVVKISDGIIHHLESKLIPQFNEYILNYIYTNILLKHKNNYSDLELGKLISRLNTIPTILRELSTDITIWVFPKLIAIIIINLYFFYLNKKLGMLSLILVIAFFINSYYMCNKCIPLSFSRHHLLEKNSEDVQDKLSNLASIYSTGRIKEEIKEYLQQTKKYSNKYKENLDCVNKIRYFNAAFDIFLFVALNGFTSYLYFQKEISFGVLMSIFITIIYYLPCLSTMSSSLPDIVHYMGVLSETDDFLKEIYGHHKNMPIKPKLELDSGDVLIQNLTFGYEGKSKIFNNFNLHIKDKQKVCLSGPSGNGKSTLIKIIMGYYQVPNNTVLLDGKDINDFDIDSVRSQISYVNQSNKLFNGSIYDNIMYGNSLTKQDIDNLVLKFGINNVFNNVSFETDVGIQGSNLSGGQKQIVLLLRSLGNPHKLIIFDEPTTGLDTNTKRSALKLIEYLSKTATMILITHDESIINLCDRIIKLNNGKIVEDNEI